MATAEAQHDAHGHDHDHPEWLAHHFESPEQQFDAGKLGMWLFLAQEVLFFSGLFVAYAVYRSLHPDMFRAVADDFLNPTLGLLNTIVLLASSLAIAWGVRAAQKNQQSTLMWMHIFTLACAGFFLGVKVVEYGFKFDEGLFWSGAGNWRTYDDKSFGMDAAVVHLSDTGFHTYFKSIMGWSFAIGGALALGGWSMWHSAKSSMTGRVLAWLGVAFSIWFVSLAMAAGMPINPGTTYFTAAFITFLLMGLTAVVVSFIGAAENVWGAVCVGLGLTLLGMGGGVVVANGIQHITNQKHEAEHAAQHAHDDHQEHATHTGDGHNEAEHPGEAHGEEPHEGEAAEHPEGDSEGGAAGEEAAGGEGESQSSSPARPMDPRPVNAGNFFSIYFAMTGVHALHIIAGIIAISWIIARIARGDFGPERYGPVEYVGLYWHLVDLVWIYLFPLLYLIR